MLEIIFVEFNLKKKTDKLLYVNESIAKHCIHQILFTIGIQLVWKHLMIFFLFDHWVKSVTVQESAVLKTCQPMVFSLSIFSLSPR